MAIGGGFCEHGKSVFAYCNDCAVNVGPDQAHLALLARIERLEAQMSHQAQETRVLRSGLVDTLTRLAREIEIPEFEPVLKRLCDGLTDALVAQHQAPLVDNATFGRVGATGEVMVYTPDRVLADVERQFGRVDGFRYVESPQERWKADAERYSSRGLSQDAFEAQFAQQVRDMDAHIEAGRQATERRSAALQELMDRPFTGILRSLTNQRETVDEPLSVEMLRDITVRLHGQRIEPDANGCYRFPLLPQEQLPGWARAERGIYRIPTTEVGDSHVAIHGPFGNSHGHDPGDESKPPEPDAIDRDMEGALGAQVEADKAKQSEVDRLMDLAEKCAEDELMRPEATDALKGIVDKHGPPDTGWTKNLMRGL